MYTVSTVLTGSVDFMICMDINLENTLQDKKEAEMMKIFTWILANGATLLGCLQAVIKALKELLTGVVNLLSLFIPAATSAKLVEIVRTALNKVDEGIEFIKKYLIK